MDAAPLQFAQVISLHWTTLRSGYRCNIQVAAEVPMGAWPRRAWLDKREHRRFRDALEAAPLTLFY